MKELAKLKKYAQSWGGDLVELPEFLFRKITSGIIINGGPLNTKVHVNKSIIDFHLCPFNDNVGFCWDEKHVFYTGTPSWTTQQSGSSNDIFINTNLEAFNSLVTNFFPVTKSFSI